MRGKLAVGVSVLALTLGGAPMTALANTPLTSLTQSLQASNSSTTLDLSGTTRQADANVPVELRLDVNAWVNGATKVSGTGGVEQHGETGSAARAESKTEAGKSIRRSHDGWSKSGSCCQRGLSRLGKANGKQIERKPPANADTRQKHVSVPVSFSKRSGNGDVERRIAAKTISGAATESRRFNHPSNDGIWRTYTGAKQDSRRMPIWPAAASEPLPLQGWPLVLLSGLLITGGLAMSRRAD